MGIRKAGQACFDGQRTKVPVGERAESGFSNADNGYISHI